jgi:tetratricopeptide (TPR) repeat protein
VHFTGRTWENPDNNGSGKWTDQVWWWHRKTRIRGRRDLDLALAWLQDEPKNLRPLEAVISEASHLYDWGLASETCDRALALRKLSPRERAGFLMMKANARFEAGDRKLAARAARAAVKHDPNVSSAWVILARCAFLRADWEEALGSAQRVLEQARDGYLSAMLTGNRIWAGLVAAYSTAELGRYDVACDAAQVTFPLIPDDWPDYRDYRDLLQAEYVLWRQVLGPRLTVANVGQRLARDLERSQDLGGVVQRTMGARAR